MASYTSTPLFGGAIIVDLPSSFADVRYSSNLPRPNLKLTSCVAQSARSPTIKRSTSTKMALRVSSSTSPSVSACPAQAQPSMAQP